MPVIKLDYLNSKIRDTMVASGGPSSNYEGSDNLSISPYHEILSIFDLSLIPNNAIINSAYLSFLTSGNQGGTVAFHKNTAPWGTVTWNTKPSTESTAFTTKAIPAATYTRFDTDIKDVVQKWMNGENNYGLTIKALANTTTSVFSNSTTTSTYRPTLTIDYTIPEIDKKQVEVIDVQQYHNGTYLTSHTVPITVKKNPKDMLLVSLRHINKLPSIPVGWTVLKEYSFAGNSYVTTLYRFSDGTENSMQVSVATSQIKAIVTSLRNVKSVHYHSDIDILNTLVRPPAPTGLSSNRLLLIYTTSTGSYMTTPPMNFVEYADDTLTWSHGLSATYNHTKLTYDTNELATIFTGSSYNNSAQLISLVPFTNEAPKFDGKDEFLGDISVPLVKPYTVTDTEGDTVTITEKVNGVVKRTYTGSGLQSLNLTSDWANLKIGKNTVVLEAFDSFDPTMKRVRTWTFLKILSDNATLIESVKGVAELKSVIENWKQLIVDKIGGNVLDTFEEILNSSSAKNVAFGTGTSSSTLIPFPSISGSTDNRPFFQVTGLKFKPSIIILMGEYLTSYGIFTIMFPEKIPLTSSELDRIFTAYSSNGWNSVQGQGFKLAGNNVVTETGFTLVSNHANLYNISTKWIAIE